MRAPQASDCHLPSHRNGVHCLAKLTSTDRSFTHETFPGRSGPCARSGSLEERNPDPSLKQLNAPTDSRLRKVENLGGAAEAAVFGSKHRIFEVAQIKREIWHGDLPPGCDNGAA
jgi:hypothetical protein